MGKGARRAAARIPSVSSFIVCALLLGHIVLKHVDVNLVLTSQCKGFQGLHQFYLSNLSKHWRLDKNQWNNL